MIERTFQLIGDELWYRGHLVAVLAQSGVPASTMDDFLKDLSGGHLFDDVIIQCTECRGESIILHSHDCSQYKKREDLSLVSGYESALDDVLRDTKPFTKSGLIRRTDLERVCAQLKEEE